ncbi:MAG TPA: hypothetical protein VJ124_20145 [Pyrinomonadaceae bacterium]|nr:hypothetical protein [Pyrinomonadaceae bacterium]
MASRVAAQLRKEKDVEVETNRGGLGEFSVTLNGNKVVDTNRLWYPSPAKVVRTVQRLLAE